MVVQYKENSNLRNTPVGRRNLDLYVPSLTPTFENTTEMTITQKYHRRPDVLAYDLYGDARYWWIFTLFNRNSIVDPINDFILGLRIVVPPTEYITNGII